MNEARRKILQKVSEGISLILPLLESAYEDEKDAFENMPEGLQASERGEQAQTAIDVLSDAVNSLNETRDKVDEALGV